MVWRSLVNLRDRLLRELFPDDYRRELLPESFASLAPERKSEIVVKRLSHAVVGAALGGIGSVLGLDFHWSLTGPVNWIAVTGYLLFVVLSVPGQLNGTLLYPILTWTGTFLLFAVFGFGWRLPEVLVAVGAIMVGLSILRILKTLRRPEPSDQAKLGPRVGDT